MCVRTHKLANRWYSLQVISLFVVLLCGSIQVQIEVNLQLDDKTIFHFLDLLRPQVRMKTKAIRTTGCERRISQLVNVDNQDILFLLFYFIFIIIIIIIVH
jgi:hypothetical protein